MIADDTRFSSLAGPSLYYSEQWQIDPANVVMVGDSLYNDVSSF